MTDKYVLDLNLVLPRTKQPSDRKNHTFDYMLQGNGTDYTTTLAKEDEKFPAIVNAHGASLKDAWLTWPNVGTIYPYIRWRRYVYEPRSNWEWDFGEDGVHLRTIVFRDLDTNRVMRAALGMAELNHRDIARFAKEKDLRGVPKLLARYEGTEARFLTLLEPYKGASTIESYRRIDERAVEVKLKDKSADFVFVKRTAPKYVFVKLNDKRQLISLKALGGVKEVKMGDTALASVSRPIENLSVDITDGKLRVYAVADQAATVNLPFLNNKSLALKAGTNRVEEAYAAGAATALTPEALAGYAALNPPAAAAEADDMYAMNTSKLVFSKNYRYPYVYADGAYDGLEKYGWWQTGLSSDGKTVVYGGVEHFFGGYAAFVECFKDGKLAWRHYPTDNGRAVSSENEETCFARQLKVSAKGDRIVYGTDKGYVECLDGNGMVLWTASCGSLVVEVDCTPDAGVVAAAAGKKALLFGGDGKLLFSKELPQAVTQTALAKDGKTVCFVTLGPSLYAYDDKGTELFRYAKAKVRPFKGIALTADGKTIAVGSEDYSVYALSRKGEPVWQFTAEEGVIAVKIADDGSRIAAAGGGGGMYYLDSKGKLLWKFQTTFASYFVDMTPDGKYVATVDPTGAYYLMSGEGKLVTRTPIRWPEPMVMALTPNGKYTSVAGIGYEVSVFENAVK
jgi:WD40 repeat protein